MDYKKLADLLFPHITLTTEEIEKKYPKRELQEGQVVSRYAPSPTGYMHIGNFFQMFISYNLTRVTDGKFFLYVNGGEKSPYKEENIKRMSAIKAEEFLAK